MTNWLSTQAVALESAPYSWTLNGNSWDVETNGPAPWGAFSDGYEVIATLGWITGDSEAAGTGACVEALDIGGAQI